MGGDVILNYRGHLGIDVIITDYSLWCNSLATKVRIDCRLNNNRCVTYIEHDRCAMQIIGPDSDFLLRISTTVGFEKRDEDVALLDELLVIFRLLSCPLKLWCEILPAVQPYPTSKRLIFIIQPAHSITHYYTFVGSVIR